MIHIEWFTDDISHFKLEAASEDEVKGDIKTLLNGFSDAPPKVLMIFLEELSHIQPKLEERIKDVQNSISDSDRESDHKRTT